MTAEKEKQTITPMCHPHGFSKSVLCDEYYSWNDKPKGKVRGFVFWFADCFDPPTYFVPMEEPFGTRELSLQDALEAWIDWLFEHKRCDVIGGGYEGSPTFQEFARDYDNEEEAMNALTFGASYYAIESESWNAKESYIEVDGIEE